MRKQRNRNAGLPEIWATQSVLETSSAGSTPSLRSLSEMQPQDGPASQNLPLNQAPRRCAYSLKFEKCFTRRKLGA